jgi:hypothetical protein
MGGTTVDGEAETTIIEAVDVETTVEGDMEATAEVEIVAAAGTAMEMTTCQEPTQSNSNTLEA